MLLNRKLLESKRQRDWLRKQRLLNKKEELRKLQRKSV
jgi:hypothetical protein